MLLTITYTGQPATDLGYLLHKNPARLHSVSLAFGTAYVFYPEAMPERCTAALVLDIDPVDLAKGHRSPSSEEPSFEYVNDRPYVASSFLSVAIVQAFGTALSGRSKERPEIVDKLLPLQVSLTMLPARGGEDLIRRLFEPLGYQVSVQDHQLDEKFPEWGASRYYTVTLAAECRLADLLSHLYVLIPVLDQEKHYWVGDDEVDKLLRHGAGWLAAHPERELIANRYLKRKRSLVDAALSRLLAGEEPISEDLERYPYERFPDEGYPDESYLDLNERRLGTVVAALKEAGAKRVIDLGCGEGKLLGILLQDRSFREIAGMDVSHRTLERAHERLKLDRLPPKQKERIKLFHGSLTYRDKRFQGYDAATVVEVIEHLDASRLAAFERVLFEFARPPVIIVTTPNIEYNVNFWGMSAGQYRHRDHRFEWTREEFRNWASKIKERFGYKVTFLSIGDEDPVLGAPTQMGVFKL